MELRFKGRQVNITAFQPAGKDLRKLVGVCDCGQVVRGKEAIPHVDPYTDEVNHGNALIVQCKRCDCESARDI
jgi:hypothetical protein